MEDIKEFHWLLDMVQNIDVGLVVLDREYKIHTWNGFMENHSGMLAYHVKGKVLFDLFPEIDVTWFKRKTDSVFLLKNSAFTTWEQRPYIFKFLNYRPITGTAEYMFQNTTIFPLESIDGTVQHISLLVYDTTDVAVNRSELKSANDRLEVLSKTDALTKLNNRGAWEDMLYKEFKRSIRTQQRCSLVMFDIDHFKSVNDTYGHAAGDEVIRVVAKKLTENKRETDLAGRYGGEEFGVILIDTFANDAMLFCERLREEIAQSPVFFEGNEIKFTISLGIAEFTGEFEDYQQWLQAADAALYRSKENGRNQTNTHGQ